MCGNYKAFIPPPPASRSFFYILLRKLKFPLLFVIGNSRICPKSVYRKILFMSTSDPARLGTLLVTVIPNGCLLLKNCGTSFFQLWCCSDSWDEVLYQCYCFLFYTVAVFITLMFIIVIFYYYYFHGFVFMLC